MTRNASASQSHVILSTRDGYDQWSAFYDQDDNPLVQLEEPIVAAMLGPCDGLRVLDVGCGTGRWCCRLAAEGADVTAFDFSQGMLKKAAAKGMNRVRFLVHDVGADMPFADAVFDRIICGLVLDHVPDLVRLFREIARVCRPDGFAIASIMHPALMLKGTQARFRDPQTGIETRPRSEPHQISDYVNALVASGARMDELREFAVDAALAARAPRAEKYMGWPMLLTIKLRPAAVVTSRM